MKRLNDLRSYKSFVELALIRFGILVMNLVTIQFVLLQIGAEKFGTYSIVLVLFSLGSLFDIGLSNGLVSPLSIAYSNKEFNEVKILISKTINCILLTTFTLSAFSFLSLQYLDISNFFNVPSVLESEFKKTLSVILLLIPLNSFSLLATKISVSLGLANQNARWLAMTVFFTCVSSIAIISIGGSLFELVLTQIMTPTIIGALNLAVLSRRFPEISPSFSLKNFIGVKTVLKNGGLYFYMQIAAFFSYHIDILVVAFFLDPTNVAILSISWKVASIPFLIVSASLLPFWQKSAIKFERERSVQQLTIDLLKVLTPILFIWSTLFVLFGNRVIAAWTQGGISPSFGLILSCAVWAFLASLMSGLSVVLNGIRAEKFLYTSTALFVLLNILLSMLVTSFTLNPAGPIIGSILSSLIAFFGPFIIFFKRILNQNLILDGSKNE